MLKPVLFIDGESGTTGLEIRKRLEDRHDIEKISIAGDKRKDRLERKRLLNMCDLAILCLPDEAAREAVLMVDNPHTRILDASTAYRVAPDWVYGFPELTSQQEKNIHEAKRVSNPGCYPTGMLALIRPLVDTGIIPPEYSNSLTVNAISGYSGGGKELIELCESTVNDPRNGPYCLYGLDQKHKHLAEMRTHAGLKKDPIFLPSYSNAFYRGMLIQIALDLKDLYDQTGLKIAGAKIHSVLTQHYACQKYVKVGALQENLEKTYILSPLSQNGTNNLELQVFYNHEKETVILTACLDNLGKGAAGAAIQNIDIMLGLN